MKKEEEKKDYQKPELTQYENLNEVTKGEVSAGSSSPR